MNFFVFVLHNILVLIPSEFTSHAHGVSIKNNLIINSNRQMSFKRAKTSKKRVKNKYTPYNSCYNGGGPSVYTPVYKNMSDIFIIDY